jgi:hypothetical protein
MSQSAGVSRRVVTGAVAMLLPALGLGACSSRDQVMADKLAAAEAAADRAIAAQHAAEKAAAAAAAVQPPPAPPPAVVSDLPEPESDLGSGDEGPSADFGAALSYGGPGQTVAPDGTVVPGV